ncbi:hypothetical protein ABG067_007864 [Albugo candida]
MPNNNRGTPINTPSNNNSTSSASTQETLNNQRFIPSVNNITSQQQAMLADVTKTYDAKFATVDETLQEILRELRVRRHMDPTNTHRNAGLAKVLRETYESSGEVWDLKISMLKGDNKRIFEKVEQLAFDTPYFKKYMVDPIQQTKYKAGLKKNAHQVIRNHFEYLQRVEREKKLSEEVKEQKRLNKAYYRRLHTKFKRRFRAFKEFESRAITGFGTKEECDAVMDKSLMSDEEDDVVMDGEHCSSFVVLKPLWRSEQVRKYLIFKN